MATGSRRLVRGLAVAAAVLGSTIVAGQSGGSQAAYALALPDLQVLVPTDAISIGTNPGTGDRQLQFTHVTWDAGAGPFAIQPSYDPTSGLSSFRQVLYRRTGPARWAAVRSVPLARDGIFEPPSDTRYPLTRFTLNAVTPGGAIGQVVKVSPKVDYCITADTFVGGVPDSPSATAPPQGNCASPTKLLGFSVGWGDQYDQTDNGQPIDLTGVPDGTYVLRATVDPQHLFVESNRDNDVVDTKLEISGMTVTVLSQTRPLVVPPTVRVVSPLQGATVRGTVTLEASAQATAPATVASVQYLMNGEPVGPPLTEAPYRYAWVTGTLPGSAAISAQVTDSSGTVGTAPVETVHVARSEPTGFGIDAAVSATGHGSVRTAGLTTSRPGETVLALVGLDGPSSGRQSTTVSGGGLRWHLFRRADAQAGDAEVWTARAIGRLRAAHVASTPSVGGFAQQLEVLAMSGASGVGAGATASSRTGAPAVSLTTRGAGSEVLAVGADWDQAIPRTPAAGQQVLSQWVDQQDGDTFWVQDLSSRVGPSGTHVAVVDTAPTADRWDLAAVEVRAAPLPAAAVAIDAPARGETVSSTTPIAVVVRDPVAVRSVRIELDGEAIGTATGHRGLFTLPWRTNSAANGVHVLSALVTDRAGRTVRTRTVVAVANPRPPMTCFVLQADAHVTGTGGVETSRIHLASTGERLLAVVQGGPTARVRPVTSTPRLGWRLVRAVQGAGGTEALFTARAPRVLDGVRVAASAGPARVSLAVLAMEGTAGIGASDRWTSGARRDRSLVTRRSTSLVIALVVGTGAQAGAGAAAPIGWAPLARAAGQGWTSWVRYTDQPVADAGTKVPIAPRRGAGRWVAVAVELPGDG